MNIVTRSCCIIILGVSIMAFTQWHEPHCQLMYMSHDPETDHQLTNELVYRFTRDFGLFNTTRVSVFSD
jgi:protein-S-isoprenylcysteine O-methyltransferase Ste14